MSLYSLFSALGEIMDELLYYANLSPFKEIINSRMLVMTQGETYGIFQKT